MKIKIACLLFTGLVVSCSKTEVIPKTETDSPHFVNVGLAHFGNLRIYTSNGEVASTSLAQKYRSEFNIYFIDESSLFTDPEFREFIVVNEDSILNVSQSTVRAKRKAIDTYDVFDTGYNDIVNDTNDITLHIVNYKGLQKKTVSGFDYFENEKLYILKKTGDTLLFPMMKCVFFSRQPGISKFVSVRLNNLFSAAGLTKMDINDTLVIQNFDVVMKRQ